jgi:hypothetical protein
VLRYHFLGFENLGKVEQMSQRLKPQRREMGAECVGRVASSNRLEIRRLLAEFWSMTANNMVGLGNFFLLFS